MPIKLANNASGTLATAINATDTGLVLTTGDGAEFPALSAGEYFYATLTSPQGTMEIVKVTARSGDSLTVVRAQEGTVANGFAAGTSFELRVTATSVDDYVEQYAELGTYTPAGASAVPTTIQAKLRGTVSVKDFGAVGDGVTNDKAAIAAAIASGAKQIYFPTGTYYKAGTGASQQIVVPTGVKLVGAKGAVIKSEGYPIFQMSEKTQLEGLEFDNTAGGVSIGLQIYGDDVTIRDCSFEGGSQLIYIYTADRLLVDGCYFTECGYQVLQRYGHVSNDCRVVNCTAVDCTADFVELNSTASAPCTNWLISGNTVRNVGTSGGVLSVEDRFVGITATKNVVITNNLVEGVAGDSMMHFESLAGDVVVSNNSFIDPHGQYGRLVFITGGTPMGSFHFSDNVVRLSSTYTSFPSENSPLMYLSSSDDTRPFITNNTFINESAETVTVITMTDTEDTLISGNRFVGFGSVIRTGYGADTSISPYNKRTVRFKDNIVENISVAVCAITNGGLVNRSYGYYIDDNVFLNCAEVYTAQDSSCVPYSLTNNYCRNGTNIDEAQMIGSYVSSETVVNNRLDNATTTRASYATYDTPGVAKTIFTATNYQSYYLKVKSFLNNPYNYDSTTKIVKLDYNNPIDIDLTEISSSNSGVTATFTLSMSGANLQFTAGANRNVAVSIVGSLLPTHTQIV